MFDESAENQEVAEPEEVETPSAENQEVAEPEERSESEGRSSADAAFAEMRRRAEAAERKAAEYEAEQAAREEAIKQLTNGNENGIEAAIAESYGLDVDDVIATLDAHTESAKKDLRIEELESEIVDIQAEKQMEDDLRLIQSIDPTITKLSDLGETFLNLTAAGVNATDAYYAAKGRQITEKAIPPKPIGKVGTTVQEKEYFTEAEVDAMSEEEQRQNYEKIMKSMTKW